MPQMIKVDSSNIAEIGYEKEILTVVFCNGSVYEYYNIPEKTFKDLLNAESHGSYLAKNIKGHFKYTRII